MITIEEIPGTNRAIKFVNLRLRAQTYEERYEGYMRSDFKQHKIKEWDSFEVIHNNVRSTKS